jgi:hypothetical protein
LKSELQRLVVDVPRIITHKGRGKRDKKKRLENKATEKE